jgi:hypothetical protein
MTDRGDDEDRAAILSRRRLLVAGALSGIGIAATALAQPQVCLSPPVPVQRFSREPGRRNTPLARVPEVIRARLPNQAIYAAGGGLTSEPWRVVLETGGRMTAGRGDSGGPSHGSLPITWAATVPFAQVREIVVLGDRAWREDRSPTRHPTADYDEVLAMRDDGEVFFAQGFGPLRGGAAELLLTRLRQLADATRPSDQR